MKSTKQKFSSFFSNFSRENIGAIKKIPASLTRIDKIAIAFFIGLICFSIGMFWLESWLKTTQKNPTYGGTYTEGFIGEPKDLEKHLLRLTNVGLTKFNENNEIVGDLAESWEIKDDGKTYIFKLREGYFAQDLINEINSKKIWSNIETSVADERNIQFQFKQPFSPFLYIATEPLFPYGPYKLIKEEKNQVVLANQENYYQGKPFIERIVFNLYEDNAALNKAIKAKNIYGFLANDGLVSLDKSRKLQFILPRELVLFFNLQKEDLKNKELRQNLRENKELSKDYNFVLVTSDNPKNTALADNIKLRWAPLKVNLEIKKYDKITLQKDIIPKREYDILLYGLDYGPDPDPYPFWHSSQIKPDGANLSNFSNKNADKLLEDARQSFDNNTRETKYTEFKKILDNEVPFITLSKEEENFILSYKVKGVDDIYGYTETDRYLNVNKWYIKNKREKK